MAKDDFAGFAYENNMLRKLGLAPNKVSDLFTQIDYRLSDFRTDSKEILAQHKALEESKQKLIALVSEMEIARSNKLNDSVLTEYCDSIKNNVAKILISIEEKQNFISSELDQNPYLVKHVKVAFTNVFQASVGTLCDIAKVFTDNHEEVPEEIKSLALKLANQREQLFANQKNTDVADSSILDEYKNFRCGIKKELANLHGIYKKYGLNADLSEKKITDLYAKNFVKILNNNPESWKVISKKIPIQGFGKITSVTSNIIPAVNLSLLKNKMTEVRGVGSNDRLNKHASNLAVTNLVNSEGKVIFSGVRHGANCAFGIENEEQRKQANVERTKEVFLACLESRPELKEQALKDQIVDLPIVSTALLSPGRLVGPARNDAKFLNEQNESWANAVGPDGTCQITIQDNEGHDKVITVRPKVIKFNFGINFLSHTVLGKILSLGGGWSKSDVMLREGIAQLIGNDPHNNNEIDPNSLVGKYLQNANAIDDKKRSQIQTLVQQIRQMVANGDYKKNSIDPSALPARIILLSHLIGAVPCYNCKSGKDRTGQVDAAVKALAFELDAGHTPHINPSESVDEKNVNVTMLRNCGNFEIQKYNTGFEGYKLEHAKNSGLSYFIGIKGLADLFDNDESLKYFKGTSKGNKV